MSDRDLIARACCGAAGAEWSDRATRDRCYLYADAVLAALGATGDDVLVALPRDYVELGAVSASPPFAPACRAPRRGGPVMARTPRTIKVQVDAADYAELHRLKAMERFVAQVFDEWVSGCAELMALFEDGLGWDEALACAVEEIRSARLAVPPPCDCVSYNHDDGDSNEVVLPRPDWMHDGERVNGVPVDPCIADVVQRLWDAGVKTWGSCCGHNGRFGPPSLLLDGGEDIKAVRGLIAEVDARRWCLDTVHPAGVDR